VQEAVETASASPGRAHFLAGGTDLLVRMKRSEVVPDKLINLKRIKGLDGIERVAGKGVRMGALAKVAQIERSPIARSSHPVLAQAASVLGPSGTWPQSAETLAGPLPPPISRHR
jgi:CO/xanthine dehydrogenase FAD-binding subunit